MINIPEQLSAARKTQLEAQLNFFNGVTSKAVASAEKLVALNLNLTRDAMAKTTAVMCQAMTAREPADLLALSTRAPDTFGALMAYSRELMAIATGASAAAPASTAPAARAVEFKVEPRQEQKHEQKAEQKGEQEVDEVLAQVAQQAADTLTAPLAEPDIPTANAFEAEAAPEVNAKAMAKAVGGVGSSNGALKSAAAPVPAAGAMVKVSGVKPVDATPAPAPASGTPEVAQQDPASAKGKRKK